MPRLDPAGSRGREKLAEKVRVIGGLFERDARRVNRSAVYMHSHPARHVFIYYYIRNVGRRIYIERPVCLA